MRRGQDMISFRDYVLALLNESDRRHALYHEMQHAALTGSTAAAKEAVEKAERSMNERLDLLNELRSGVAMTVQVEALEKVVDALAERVIRAEAKGMGMQTLLTILVGIGVLVSVVVGIVAALTR